MAATPAAAAIAYVQSTSSNPGSVNSDTLTLTFTAGNSNLVGLRLGSLTATLSISDTKSNTYSGAGGDVCIVAGGETLCIFSAHNVAGGSTTVTATVTGGPATLRWGIHEYSGLATSSTLDKTHSANGVGTAADSGATATTTQADELLFGVLDCGAGCTATAGSGYTLRNNNIGSKYSSEDQIVSATGTYSATFTITSDDWSAAIATYKAAAGGAPAAPKRLLLMGVGDTP